MISLILVPITHTWLKLSSRALRSHKLHYCISFFSLSLSRSLLFHPLFIYFLLAKETPCKLFFLLMKGSSCREEWAFLARTLHSSQSQPSIHAPAPWHGLFLWRKTNTHLVWEMLMLACCFCIALHIKVTSFQSLHCTLTSSVCGSDLLSELFNDGQQLCIFVLRHLAASRALKLKQKSVRFNTFKLVSDMQNGALLTQ